MSFEGHGREPPRPRPPELNFSLKSESDFGGEVYDWSNNVIQSQLPTDVLLIATEDDAFNACYSYMNDVCRSYCTELGYVDFGQFGDSVLVALMKCAQGQTAALIAVKNAAEVLNPRVVLFVGTCASTKPEKAKLGDVLISWKLATLDDKIILADSTLAYCGVKANVSRNMANLILHAADGWEPPLKEPNRGFKANVHRDAVILSGSDFVNNYQRREELHLQSNFRDAIGLENEGAGLYAAARDLNLEWAVIVGVSKFADGSKDETKDWKLFSSTMSASVVHNMFKRAGVIKKLPHYKETQKGTKRSMHEW